MTPVPRRLANPLALTLALTALTVLGCGDARVLEAEPTEEIVGTAWVRDGDSLRIGRQEIRVFGIDAPELAQTCTAPNGATYDCGERAKSFLIEQVRDRQVSCLPIETDSYGRTVARCLRNGEDLAAIQVANGWALAYRRYTRDYVPEEERARGARLGIWNGSFTPPEEWRAERRGGSSDPARSTATRGARETRTRDESSASRPSCPIKGNISKGGRIYHTPSSPAYDATRIDESRGERWFCSEQEARAAGWRAAR